MSDAVNTTQNGADADRPGRDEGVADDQAGTVATADPTAKPRSALIGEIVTILFGLTSSELSALDREIHDRFVPPAHPASGDDPGDEAAEPAGGKGKKPYRRDPVQDIVYHAHRIRTDLDLAEMRLDAVGNITERIGGDDTSMPGADVFAIDTIVNGAKAMLEAQRVELGKLADNAEALAKKDQG